MNSYNFAEIYDLLYSDKNYASEAQFIASRSIYKKNLLDIGCGTLNHSILLSNNFESITAIDQSNEMLLVANRKKIDAGINNIVVTNNNLSDLPTEDKFDVVIMMFNVVNHVLTVGELIKLFQNCYDLSKENGKIFFDFWNGALYRINPPFEKTIKTVSGKDLNITVKTLSSIDQLEGIVRMKMEFEIRNNQGELRLEESEIVHKLWTPDVIQDMLTFVGFNNISMYPAFNDARKANLEDRKLMISCLK
jgi:SAM-dependent methyltransferase